MRSAYRCDADATVRSLGPMGSRCPTRTTRPSIGCRDLRIHAESEAAQELHLHLIPELETSPPDDLHLVPLMKDARKTLAGSPYVRAPPGQGPSGELVESQPDGVTVARNAPGMTPW